MDTKVDIKTAKKLSKITSAFYREQCASFSQTRTAPWTGWGRCLEFLRGAGWLERCEAGAEDARVNGRGLSVFDLACGNLRFEKFLCAELAGVPLTFYAVDNCDLLLPETPLRSLPQSLAVEYQNLDVLEVMYKGTGLNNNLTAPPCDLSVSFGFLHHIPLPAHRQAVLTSLVERTCPNGYVIVSFWQFLRSANLRTKAKVTHQRALQELNLPSLDTGDYLLGWKNTSKAYRYCHSFTNTEIDALAATVADQVTEVTRFTADGKTNNLNTYLILRVH